MKDQAVVIRDVSRAITRGQDDVARRVLRDNYPFVPARRVRTTVPIAEMLGIFIRDGFTDRYRGNRLIFPGALHLLARLLPDEFPYHPHGKTDACHPAFWDLFPTVDHIVPLAYGGTAGADNLACVSMRTNQVKANWRLEDLGWNLLPSEMGDWDGLIYWAVEELERHPEIRPTGAFGAWMRAGQGATREYSKSNEGRGNP